MKWETGKDKWMQKNMGKSTNIEALDLERIQINDL